ncbi:MAG: hypothetical protein P8144_10235 [Gammaproteobacteria bacterium]
MKKKITKIVLSKVPEITIGFWVIKIIATTLGEVGGNAVSRTLEMGYFIATIIFGVPLIVSFKPALYWGTITLTTLAGTTLADFVTRSIGIGYLGGSLLLFALVMLTLAIWHQSLGSININTVVKPKAEIFYWSTIMFSQTLGTALGDWMADSTFLGYNGSALLIAAVLVAIGGLYYKTKVSHTTLFWAAFILTRPLGATLANSLDKPVSSGGLNINDITLSVIFVLLMVACLYFVPQRAGQKEMS